MCSVSIVVPTYRRTQFLGEALNGLCGQTFADQFEIIVVDNDPSDELRDYVTRRAVEKGRAIRYVAERRTGLHFARHAGVLAAQGDIVAFVDDDVLVPQGWLEAMVAPYCDPTVACVGGKIVARWESEPPGWIFPFVGGFYSILDLGDARLQLSQGEYVYGCNMSVRKEIIFKCGGFNPDGYGDPRLIWYRGNGECGLIDKIHALGYKVVYEPQAWLYHRIPVSRATETYLYRRAFTDGISASYTHFRRHPTHQLGILYRIANDALHWCYWWVRSRASHKEHVSAIQQRMIAENYRARVLHGMKLMFSPTLRAHVCRVSYLDA